MSGVLWEVAGNTGWQGRGKAVVENATRRRLVAEVAKVKKKSRKCLYE